MKYHIFIVGLVASILAPQAHASYGELKNEKGTCLFLKNDKVVKKTACRADGVHSATVAMGGWGLDFKPIAGYGKVSVDYSFEAKTDEYGTAETDSDGNIIMAHEKVTINKKPATHRYRHNKTHKIIDNQTFWADKHFQCFIAKRNPAYEFCTDIGF